MSTMVRMVPESNAAYGTNTVLRKRMNQMTENADLDFLPTSTGYAGDLV
jgi:hypothetical protein